MAKLANMEFIYKGQEPAYLKNIQDIGNSDKKILMKYRCKKIYPV